MNYSYNLYHFRQESTFLYFFGIDRPGLMALIYIDSDKEVMFGDDLTIEQMVRTGYQQPLAAQVESGGISTVKTLDKLQEIIKQAIGQNNKIHFLPPYRSKQVQSLSAQMGLNYKAITMCY